MYYNDDLFIRIVEDALTNPQLEPRVLHDFLNYLATLKNFETSIIISISNLEDETSAQALTQIFALYPLNEHILCLVRA